MADILPIRAWRYNRELGKQIDDITSPLFDVVTEKQLEKLYTHPYASIHLSVPRGENPAESANEILEKWKIDGIIEQDPLPGIYVYYQHYSLPGSIQEYTRKGFIANLKLSEWEDKVVLRHEKTMPQQVNTRIELLEKTGFNISPTHGYYTDPDKRLEQLMDEAITVPLHETEDYQGVRDAIAVIHDWNAIREFIATIKDKQIILADGHHRYEASLVHWRKMRERENHSGEEGYNYHLMYFTNTEEEQTRILATHRLISGLEDVQEDQILKKLDPYFTIKPIEDAFLLPEIIRGKTWAFGLLFKESAYKVRLKEGALEQVYSEPSKINRLDVSVAHKFIIEIGLGIPLRDQLSSANISYDRSFSDCYAKILQQEAQMGIILNEIDIETVKSICYSGSSLPQKSTYFYPKVISGFLFSSIIDEEFKFPFGLSF